MKHHDPPCHNRTGGICMRISHQVRHHPLAARRYPAPVLCPTGNVRFCLHGRYLPQERAGLPGEYYPLASTIPSCPRFFQAGNIPRTYADAPGFPVRHPLCSSSAGRHICCAFCDSYFMCAKNSIKLYLNAWQKVEAKRNILI